jgi:CCR4-NOT transcription complex subunit 2
VVRFQQASEGTAFSGTLHYEQLIFSISPSVLTFPVDVLQLPSCYYMQPPALKTGHLSKFQQETLFYIFYALPKDLLQAYAAQELYTREWRFHGELKLWFKRAGPADGLVAPQNNAGAGSGFLYFDISSWERRLFNGSIQNITSGFLTEDEVRVKFPNT